MSELDDYFNNGLFDKSYKYYEGESKLKKIKKVLTEIVKVGGWIIVAIEKLLEIM